MDNGEKNKLKYFKKESSKSRGPLLKPDVILITKDVMLPVKLNPSFNKRSHDLLKGANNKSKIVKLERNDCQTVDESYLEKVEEPTIDCEEEIERETIPPTAFYSFSTADETSNDSNFCKNETESLKKDDSNSINFHKEDKINTACSSTVNSICSLTASASSKYFNIVEDSISKSNSKKSSSSLEREFHYNEKLSGYQNTDQEFIESSLDIKFEKLLTDSVREEQLVTPGVENPLASVSQDLLDNCKEELIEIKETFGENDSLKFDEKLARKSGYDSKERIPKIVEFRYSLHDLIASNLKRTSNVDLTRNHSSEEFGLLKSTKVDSEREENREEAIYNNPNIDSSQGEDRVQVKYSWQIITPEKESREALNTEINSKLTDTEDLNFNQPEIQYSWQKLTAKYLAPDRLGDSFTETGRSEENINEILKHKGDSVLRSSARDTETMKNSKDKQESKEAEDAERIVDNYPLNNIISSMLPEIKLFNRRTSFNNNNLLSEFNNSSVSSIKHVIANLNAMVTTQKHILDTYDQNSQLNKNSDASQPSEKVEIFPSTLHVLGNYIIRDIRAENMNDQRNLLDANKDETLQDKSVVLENQIPVEKSSDTNSSIDSSAKLLKEMKESDFLNMLNDLSAHINNSKKDETLKNSLILPVPGKIDKDSAIAGMEEIMELSYEAACHMDGSRDDGNMAVPHTKNTGPLKPRVEVSFSDTKEPGDGKTRRDELLIRLESAMSRLKQCEQHVDANWNLDYSALDTEETISDEDVKLPEQVEEHIKDIIKSAEEYLAKLEEQLNDLRNADDQIINSSERTFRDIDETYQRFIDNLCKEINKRRNLVRLETEVFKYEGLAPLRACKQEVDAQIRSTQHLIVLTENMLTHPVTFNRERLGKIITATSHMGRIPAVPMPEELPYVTFSPPSEELTKEIVDRISCVGCVLRMGPAQFTEVFERPGGLQLKWNLVDPEFASEEQTFVVQKAPGEIEEPNSSTFHTIYVGQETSCFVRDLTVDQLITLRVGIQVSDTAWSVHRIVKTSIPAYSWDLDNSDYLITNSGKIATKVTQNLSTLLSRGAQFSANHVIEFKFLEASTGTDDEGIGLAFEPGGGEDNLKRNGAILITPNGSIFMNGEKKLMKLPKIELGTRIIFTSESKDEDTLRMNIECGNKAVTYDWTVPRPLHFVARFTESNKWNLMVK